MDNSCVVDDVADFPPTLILHGELDSIVPVAHSKEWLRAVYDHSNTTAVETPHTHTHTAPATTTATTHAHSVLREGVCEGNYRCRDEDTLVILPGAKHSYEIAASPLVDVTIQGVMGWLTMQNNRLH